ncbi:MAG TPA: serpin family protein [Polyangiaceae bacterium]|nr:serpin family protein [Polyangiaceae bacterium]
MKPSLCFLPLLVLALGCGSDSNDTPGGGSDTPDIVNGVQVQDGVARLTSALERRQPELGAADLRELVADNTRFAFDLYAELGSGAPEKNLFCSPHSISTAMAMAYVGARTDTKDALASALHFAQTDDTLHQGFNALDRALGERQRPAEGDRPGLTLRVSNDIWASQVEHERPLPAFVDALALDYRSRVSLVNFGNEPEARGTINKEVSRQTEGKIENLLALGIITPGVTTMILTNSIYFKGAWAQPFEKAKTQPAPFTNLDGSTSEVRMMEVSESFAYAETAELQVVRLPYTGGETALTVLLPKSDFAAVEASFDAARLQALRAQLAPSFARVRLPAFSMRSALRLKGPLQALGMDAGFEDSPRGYDFSGIGPAIEFISEVVHEAFIDVNEEGTEAGAATAVVFGRESAPLAPELQFVADRPFLVVLEDVPTGAVLFAGRYVTAE